MLWYTQGDLDRARSRLTRARAAGAGDMEIVAHTENMLGHVEHAAGNMQAARDCFARSNDGFRALGIPWGTGHTLTAMAWVALESGDIGQAEGLLNEATSELRHAGPWFLSLTRYLRALVAVRRGHPDEAIAWVRESLTHIRQLHDKFAFVYVLVPLAAAVGTQRRRRVVGENPGRAGRSHRNDRREGRRRVSERTAGKGGTGGTCTPRPGAVGSGVRGGPQELHRCVAEGHRSRTRLKVTGVRQRRPGSLAQRTRPTRFPAADDRDIVEKSLLREVGCSSSPRGIRRDSSLTRLSSSCA